MTLGKVNLEVKPKVSLISSMIIIISAMKETTEFLQLCEHRMSKKINKGKNN